MGQAERERQHQANLERIQRAQRVVGRGDHLRIDHEGTLLDRARMLEEELCAHHATELGLAAFDRLLRRAESQPGAQSQEIAQFIAAIRNSRPLPLATLRGLEAEVGDDMLAVLDAFRHARISLVEQVEGGAPRVARLLDARGLAKA